MFVVFVAFDKQVVDLQNSKITNLESELEEYKAQVATLQGPLNFLDFVVDLYEHYIVPAYEVTVATIKPYYIQCKEFVLNQYSAVVTFWNNNESVLSVRAAVYKYYLIACEKQDCCVNA